ncbi:tetratricopeptide repeat protein [Pelagicoccus sp. SDUM812002]|uniref:tetratricopeptide repeat protein n=1 Tax=Pelagicoccus sp. SDUM812002 TaxID=3041266 RepID=UPI00281016F0|nr:tetratricopeptide repeat protein [Pelagicoccus sp. SDUM812002]MDQ8185268.1 tetratricopeptide repeat protein [Pelagicoccus sp. SDUM812002]
MKTERFQNFVSKNPDNELFRFSLAQALIEDERYEEALEHLEFCIRKKDDWMMAEILKGKSLLALSRPEDAQPVLAHALHLAVIQHHEAPEAEIRKLLDSLA